MKSHVFSISSNDSLPFMGKVVNMWNWWEATQIVANLVVTENEILPHKQSGA